MRNLEIAEILTKIADLLEFKGEMPFKINAYRKASRTLSELGEDVEALWRENRLQEIPGIGKGIQEKIDSYLRTGNIKQLNELLQSSPKQIFDLLSIQNFGPRTASLAYKELRVETLDDLKKVLDDGSLASLPGMGEKKVENIRKGLELKQSAEERISIGIAVPIVETVIDYIKSKAGAKVGKITPAGSVRRFRETVHDIDILVETDDGPDVTKILTQMPGVTRILGAGNTKGSVMIEDRFQVDVRAVAPDSYGAAQQYFTGSKEHNVRLREIAKKYGYKINEYGIFDGNEKIGGKQEEEIYEKLNMTWIPPELREDRGEVEAALNNKIPQLVTMTDIRAELHVHSTYSDGQLSLADMAETVRKAGYDYMAITDHSKYARYANGMDEKKLKMQIEEVSELNGTYSDFKILTGIEVDILPDGSLDFGDNVLEQLDFVIASIHSAFKTDPTGRIIKAIHNKHVDVIGHPTGRLISRREGYQVDMAAIVQEAAASGTALEVNSFWDRLDLSDVHIKMTIEGGVKISINTDAHHPEHLPMMRLGVGNARRGWAIPKDVINCMSLKQLIQWQKRNR